MALTKTETLDKLEIVGEYKSLQARYLITVEEDGIKISDSYKRLSFMPDTAIEDLPAEIQSYASTAWTADVVNAYAEFLASEIPTE